MPRAVGSTRLLPCLPPTWWIPGAAADEICSWRRSSSSPQPGEGRDVHFITCWQVFKNKSAEQQPALAADQSFDIAKDKSRFGKILFGPCSLSHAIIPAQSQGSLWGSFALLWHEHTEPPGQAHLPHEGDKVVLINRILSQSLAVTLNMFIYCCCHWLFVPRWCSGNPVMYQDLIEYK